MSDTKKENNGEYEKRGTQVKQNKSKKKKKTGRN